MTREVLVSPAVLLKQQKFELETVHKLLQKRCVLHGRLTYENSHLVVMQLQIGREDVSSAISDSSLLIGGSLQGLEVLLVGHRENFDESKSIGLLKPILDQLKTGMWTVYMRSYDTNSPTEVDARRTTLKKLAEQIKPEKESQSSLSIEEEEYEISLGISSLEEAVDSHEEYVKAGNAAELARSDLESWYTATDEKSKSLAERYARGKLPPAGESPPAYSKQV